LKPTPVQVTAMYRLAALLLLAPALAAADRITEMNGAELCAYRAKLSVAAYFYFLQGKPRGDGDETQNEIDFVRRTLDEAYATAEADKRDHPQRHVSEQVFGDRAYKACMSGEGT
jgi:hypothetical protein